MVNKVFGIDLGTTYSCIAYVDANGIPTVVPNSEGQTTTPSVVYFESQANVVVGETAKDTAMVHSDRVVQTIKRFMGDASYTYMLDDRSYRPEEISALILRKIVQDAEQNTGEKISDVVITCPAYFGMNQREATRQAGVLAGLNVRYVIPEPTAAAFAYGMDRTENEVTMVYDLGGGTFDVTIIAITPDALRVVCTDGDHQLGGKDWDKAIVDYFMEEFAAQTGLPASTFNDDLEALQELYSKAERAKIQLSSRQSVTVPISASGERATIELTRKKFDELTEPLLSRTIDLMNAALREASAKNYTQIGKILLVGGSSYMPQVKDRVAQIFSGEITILDPNLIVAKGAALFGHRVEIEEDVKAGIAELLNILPGDVKLESVDPKIREEAVATAAAKYGLPGDRVEGLLRRKVSNVSSKSFGIVVLDGNRNEKVCNLLVRNDPLPRDITRPFFTVDDSQTNVRLTVMENLMSVGPDGLIDVADCSEQLGEAMLSFAKPLPAGSPLRVTFELSPDGLLKLHGKDLTTHQDVRSEFQTTAVMPDPELVIAKQRQDGISVS